MTSLPHRLRAAVRPAAARVALTVTPGAGPRRWRSFVVRTRLNRADELVQTDPGAALRLAEPTVDVTPNQRAAWRLVAGARERANDDQGALSAVRQAIDAGEHTVTTVLMRRRLALRLRLRDEADEALRVLTETPPRNGKELDRAVEALSAGDAAQAARYDEVVSSLPHIRADRRSRLDELLSEFRLADVYENDRESFRSELTAVLSNSSRPLRVVTQALARCRAWDELAEFITTTPPNSQLIGPRGSRSGFPSAEVAKAASAALSAGHATAASMLAARALVAKPHNDELRATFANAHEQRTIARRGWTFPERAATSYEPDQHAVLSVLSQSLPARSGGYATRSHGILTALAARGWRVNAVTRLGFPYDRWKKSDTRVVPDADDVDGITYHRLLEDGERAYPQYPLPSYIDRFERGVEELAARYRASMIHASSFYVAGMAGLTAARRLGVPFIYEMRGLEELMKVSRDPKFEGSDRHRFLDRLETGVALEADAVFVITEALGREMAARGVAEERIVVVPNGVHTQDFQPRDRDRALEAELGVQNKSVIGYVGGMVDYEGLDILLEAVAGLKQTRDDVHLLVVGDGANERAIHEKARQLRLGDMVTFTGRVPHDQVARYLSLVDVAPFPRLPLPVCELISPIKPFESMAMEKAVVVSDVAALTEFVEDEVTGRVFRKGDPADLRRVLEQLIEDPDRRRELGRAAREWVVRERDWSSVTAAVDETYRHILHEANVVRT